jgi:2-oxoisovalerate dehydrogenase E1 component
MAHANGGGSSGEGAPERDIVLVCSGDGATSEGEFWEALNIACLERLPVLFLVEDNEYAISVPVEAQTAGGSISKLVQSFPGLAVSEVDGLDFAESYRAMTQAAGHCRAGAGPALVHAHVIRLYAHSLSDDETLYKTPQERKSETERDPIKKLAGYIEHEGIADENTLLTIHHEVDLALHQAVDEALRAPAPASGTALRYLYSPAVDPTSNEFSAAPHLAGEPRTMVDAINLCLGDEMKRDPRIVVFGEDIADCTREANLNLVKGKGGVFRATAGLQRKYGSRRVFNATLAEAAIVGRAIGMATRGLKPVVEIQFFDYIWPAMMQIRDELATLRWRSNNGFAAPVVIRVPIGGYLGGGAIYHSQSGEVLFTHIPGLRVVFPSNALDACGLLRTAIRCDDPVLFLEHKKLYRETYNRSPYPGPDYVVPFGSAHKVKEGDDLTVVTYGALVHRSVKAAKHVEQRRGVSIEILDLRTLNPYDWEAIAASVKKTNRVMVVHEDCLSFGYGAEISARIASELFDRLDAPIGRVGALDTWVAYHPEVENEILPQVRDVEHEMERVLTY